MIIQSDPRSIRPDARSTSASASHFKSDPQLNIPEAVYLQCQQLHNNLLQQIQLGHLQINTKIDNIDLQSQSRSPQANRDQLFLQKKLKQLKDVRDQLDTKLKHVANQEKKIIGMYKAALEVNERDKMKRSQFTKEEKLKIAMARKKYEKFDDIIKAKINEVMKQIRQKSLDEEKAKSKQIQDIRKERVFKLAQKRHKTQLSKKKYRQSLQNSQSRIEHNYAYIVNEKKDEELEKQRQKYASVVLHQKKQKMKIDFNTIKEHSIEYGKYLNQKQTKRKIQVEQNQYQNKVGNKLYQNQFIRKVREEERQAKIEALRKENERKQYRNKVKSFQQYVTQNFKPKVHDKSQLTIDSQKVQKSPKTLSHKQLFEKGNEYLQVARKLARKTHNTDDSQKSENHRITFELGGEQTSFSNANSQKYPNYLEQLHKMRGNTRQQSILEKIIKQKRVSMSKMEEAIRWIDKKEKSRKIYLNKDPVWQDYASAKEKLTFLSSLYDNEVEISQN